MCCYKALSYGLLNIQEVSWNPLVVMKSVTKNDYFITRPVCLFLIFCPHFLNKSVTDDGWGMMVDGWHMTGDWWQMTGEGWPMTEQVRSNPSWVPEARSEIQVIPMIQVIQLIQVMQVIQLIQVMQVIQLIKVIQVRHYHLWPDFWVIFVEDDARTLQQNMI